MDFKDFLMEDFQEVEAIEKDIKIGDKVRKMKFKPILATLGDEIRNKCKKTMFIKNQKITEIDNDKYIANLIIETTVIPNFKTKELQDRWGVIGSEELLNAMNSKMIDGEYAELSNTVTEVNGYDKGIQELIEEAKN